jgi:hypothetical protein
MVWIARADKNPKQIFLYLPKKVEKDMAILKILSKEKNISPQQSYEILLPVEGTLQQFIGIVEEFKNSQLVVKLKTPVCNRRKFNRLKVKSAVIPIGIFLEDREKPITGFLIDISLGGFKVKISPKDFQTLKESAYQTPLLVVFRLLEDNFIAKTLATPIRFDEKEKTVAFTFPFGSDSGNALRIYEKVIKVEKNNDG